MLLNVLVLDGDIERVRPPLRCSFRTPLMSHDDSSQPLVPQCGLKMTLAVTCLTSPPLVTLEGLKRKGK
jgi:hypothetical protein